MQREAGLSRRALADRSGSTAVVFSLLVPFLVMLVGGAIDYGQALVQKQRLQGAVDKAAMAAARELGLSDARRENVEAVVAAVVASAMKAGGEYLPLSTLASTVSDSPLEVAVLARQPAQSAFGAFGLGIDQIEVHAVARIVGRPNICVLALDPRANGAISLEANARVTGQTCAVFSNSTHPNGIRSKSSANMTATTICTAGGKDGGHGNFTPEPLTDCPTFDDPLSARPEPPSDPCATSVPRVLTGTTTLSPGTYCGGIEIASGASVTLSDGIYVIKNGGLTVRDGGALRGEGVGFFLVGQNSQVLFERLPPVSAVLS
jgi:hypothetical protein